MIKFGLKPAMATSLADGDNPIEQLETIIDFAKARFERIKRLELFERLEQVEPGFE